MEYRQLGRTDLKVAPLCFGGNVFGWTADEATSFKLLDAFVERGFNFIDTADSYSRWVPGNKGGESERIIGNWMKQRGNREKVIVGTKVGSDMGQGHKDVSKRYILRAVEDSLRRLQTHYIDLYQTHWDNENTPVEETLEAYDKLVRQGKVRWIGASNLSPERLRASLACSKNNNFPIYQTLQPEYNLYDREGFEHDYLEICREEGLSVITYYSLASGFLTGKYRTMSDLDKSTRGAGIRKYLDDKGMRILSALDEVAARNSSTPAAVALAWLMAQPTIAAPIASATNTRQLEELMSAAELKLSAEDLEVLGV